MNIYLKNKNIFLYFLPNSNIFLSLIKKQQYRATRFELSIKMHDVIISFIVIRHFYWAVIFNFH